MSSWLVSLVVVLPVSSTTIARQTWQKVEPQLGDLAYLAFFESA